MSYIAYCLVILDYYTNRMGWVVYVACVERMRHRLAHKLFVEERQGKRLLGRLLRMREDNIKIPIKNSVGWCELCSSNERRKFLEVMLLVQ